MTSNSLIRYPPRSAGLTHSSFYFEIVFMRMYQNAKRYAKINEPKHRIKEIIKSVDKRPISKGF